jgi:hypothetical protein
MDQTEPQHDDAMEQALSQWGAQQSIEDATLSLPPLHASSPVHQPYRWWPQVPLAMAASILLMVLGGVFVIVFEQWTMQPAMSSNPQATSPGFVTTPTPVHVIEQRADSQGPVSPDPKLIQLHEQTRQQNELLQKQLKEILANQPRNQQSQEQLTQQITTLTKRLALADQTQAALTQQVEKLNQQLVNQQQDAQSLKQTTLAIQQQLADQQANYQQQLADLQSLYLQSIKLSNADLPARQAAAREHRMLARLSTFRQQISDSQTHQLLDQLEVAFTRLELLDAQNVQEIEHLSQTLKQQAIDNAIEQTLQSQTEQSAFRTWLLEARLILSGVDHAS